MHIKNKTNWDLDVRCCSTLSTFWEATVYIYKGVQYVTKKNVSQVNSMVNMLWDK